jgi:hypothetical protein
MADGNIEYSTMLGRRVRQGVWQDQVISTYRKIQEAVNAASWDDAAALANYFVEEAEVCFALYRQWVPDLQAFLVESGTNADDIPAIDAAIMEKLRLPNGDAFERYRQWSILHDEVAAFVKLAHQHDAAGALVKLDAFKEVWRQIHDRDVDHTYGLMHEIVTRHGESSIGPMWDKVLAPLFSWRYGKFDISQHPWEEALENLMLVAIEAMRGHLVGPERTGDMELEELDDRYILRFDACGSGQRTVRGDWIEDTPPRMEPPYNWSASEEPHPWNHYQKGVCHYCTHCIHLMEEMPIDNFGYPLRVIDPPIYPDTDRDPAKRQKCQWTMFKDPTKVPEEMYARSGRTKAGKFGSAAVGAPPIKAVTTGLPGSG